jgi:hypothetical protein
MVVLRLRRPHAPELIAAVTDEFSPPAPSTLMMDARRPSTIVCDAGSLAADASTVDALARLGLMARRLGLEIRICHASAELQQLLLFVGLREVLRVEPGLEPDAG